jgi:hypothetical protein
MTLCCRNFLIRAGLRLRNKGNATSDVSRRSSMSRIVSSCRCTWNPRNTPKGDRHFIFTKCLSPFSLFGGDEGDRTPGLGVANAALSQLSYIPIFFYASGVVTSSPRSFGRSIYDSPEACQEIVGGRNLLSRKHFVAKQMVMSRVPFHTRRLSEGSKMTSLPGVMSSAGAVRAVRPRAPNPWGSTVPVLLRPSE